MQERGLYFAHTWDAGYQPLLEFTDPAQPPHQGGLLVADGSVAQEKWPRLRAGGFPVRRTAMPRQCGKRAGGSEIAQVAPVELCAPGQVFDVGEPCHGAGGGDPRGAGLRKALHHEQSQPHGRLGDE